MEIIETCPHDGAPARLTVGAVGRARREVRCTRCPTFVFGDDDESVIRAWNDASIKIRGAAAAPPSV